MTTIKSVIGHIGDKKQKQNKTQHQTFTPVTDCHAGSVSPQTDGLVFSDTVTCKKCTAVDTSDVLVAPLIFHSSFTVGDYGPF